MKQSLQLRLGQQLAMTPQLQQAIKLLQMSTLELQQEIQQALDSNMMLEVTDEEEQHIRDAGADEIPITHTEPSYAELPDLDAQTTIPDELPVDSSWEDVFDGVHSYAPSGAAEPENEDFLGQRGKGQSLQEYLRWQMELTPFTERDHAIATAIIDAIDDDGYLDTNLEGIHQGLSSQLENLEKDEVQAVLHRIQNFDPPGIAAENPADCLRIQLQQMPENTPYRAQAIELVCHHVDLLAKKDLVRLKKALELDDDDLAETIRLVRSLDPKPGRSIELDDYQYIIPDVFVYRQGAEWAVALNPEIAPKLRVNPYYSGLIRRADSSPDNVTMRNHLQEARWFIKSLQSRNETLLKVARAIVDRQREFLDVGETAMKPLVLRDIAEEVSMHESTISRVTTQKYMHTPNGIYEFKYFFSSHVSTDSGGECSATAIKAFLREIVSKEEATKPLSDHAIAGMLKDKGINVARRTIAKYREAMGIPPSNERKQLF
ncbi:RNA polymerase factor sigma-54 [Methylococcus geothermalis]|uniref:RNA polymerase sigma-54 factor n=1 Tax=Methylococcus geothermalis TaxID=2681310 RepID=A0A858QBA1_9GAMM|nr:RNA polymerase factor sigma-54 [Methylococcus geothermalis]QJD30995.1 RNA polymerase factor sigma-54 [Methylococcus geothermalis]